MIKVYRKEVVFLGIQFAWFFDAVLVALLLISLYIGGKRGFIRSVLMIAGYILSFAAAYFVSTTAAPIIYEKFAQEKIVSVIETNIGNINVTGEIKNALGLDEMGITVEDEEINQVIANNSGDLSEDIRQYISQKTGGAEVSKEDIDTKLKDIFDNSVISGFIDTLPSYMTETVTEYMTKSNDVMSNTLKALTSTKAEAAQYIEANIVRNSVIPIIKLLLFILVFTIAIIIVKMITRLFSGFNRVPIAGSINVFLGAILGLAQGIAIVLIIAVILHILVALSNDEMIVFNSQTIQNTYLFKLFYNFKLLK